MRPLPAQVSSSVCFVDFIVRGADRKAAILLLMQGNPAEDWQRLTEHYREMSDGELEELAADFVDLTETAQQVLRNEMRSRGLDESPAVGEAPMSSVRPVAPRWASSVDPDAREIPPDDGEGNQEDDLPREYTWKTPLCECDDREQAWEIHEVLRRAGIESWVEQPGSRYSFGISSPRVMVAADQLEEAREIASRPIPQEVIDQSRMDVPDFEAPKCPKCGAGDPVLESADPTNVWLCEACGNQWTEPAAEADREQEQAGQ